MYVCMEHQVNTYLYTVWQESLVGKFDESSVICQTKIRSPSQVLLVLVESFHSPNLEFATMLFLHNGSCCTVVHTYTNCIT